ncbi:uncharacterized protein LOC143448311 [Clavelina lepadiformis]|uniref:cellulase n=1 Tax=Clavelina lepadiformis TaxID=159417 RepID=A0ABP0G5P3_CLALP
MKYTAVIVLIPLVICNALAQNSDGTVVEQFKENQDDVMSILNLPNDTVYLNPPPFDYAEALAKSLLFYEAQRSGRLPDNQRVKWRGDSALDDGLDDVGIDLSGGYYDGGGYVKYGYTMAYTATVLSWGVIRYRRAYEILGQLDYVLAAIKWATDYFIKCHPKEDVFYGQVGDKSTDNAYFGRPETMNYKRRAYSITKDRPGSDLAGETAAAMAAAAIVFEPTSPAYAEKLLAHAKELYEFAITDKGIYSTSITAAREAYQSDKYVDDLAWAGAWLYKTTGDKSYLTEAEIYYGRGKLKNLATEFSWRDKRAGVQILLAELTKKPTYRTSAKWFCDYAQKEKINNFNSQSKHTPRGLLYVQEWGSLRYSANTAMICLMAADLGLKEKGNYRVFARQQIGYILGRTGRSFVVGFGENPPTKIFHESSYCPSPPAECGDAFNEGTPNAHILYGALVGGPNSQDLFQDQRGNQQQSSVAIDYNAGFQSALAGLLDLDIFGPIHRPHIDKPGQITLDEVTLPPPTIPPTLAPVVGIDYRDAIKKSILFYEAQRSGVLPYPNRIPWRGDSAVHDGKNVGVELDGGYYDGPGYIKYTFPLCYTMTMLSWGLIEFQDAYKNTRTYKDALNTLQWGMNYITKAHIYRRDNNQPNTTLVAQVGDSYIEDTYWGSPENMDVERPVYSIRNDEAGTEVAAEMAAAFAAASMAFKGQDRLVSERYFNQSHYLYNFVVKKNLGVYSDTITDAQREYPSSGYIDELAWAATWLYQHTRSPFYFKEATGYYDQLPTDPKDFSWDNKTVGVQLLLGAAHTGSKDIAKFCDWLLTSARRTEGGLLFLNDKYPAKYAANAAFILIMAFKKFPKHRNARRWRDLGVQQIEYLLGNINDQSFMIGFGAKSPTQPYHKASSCPSMNETCGLGYKTLNVPNPHVLFGALVGGPDFGDEYQDLRTNENQNRVSLDANAGFQSALAGIQHLKINKQLGNSAASVTLCPTVFFAFLSVYLYFMINA